MIRYADPDGFAEFGVTTNFSFLRGASHPEELVAQAIVLGLAAIGIADRNSLAGIVRAHLFLRHNNDDANGLRVLSGCRLVFCDGTPDILAYPQDRAAYGRLCRLLTIGNIRAEKGTCRLTLDDLLEWQEGLQLIVLPTSTFDPEVEARIAKRAFEEYPERQEEHERQTNNVVALNRDTSLLPLAGEGGLAKRGRMRDLSTSSLTQEQTAPTLIRPPLARRPPSPASGRRMRAP